MNEQVSKWKNAKAEKGQEWTWIRLTGGESGEFTHTIFPSSYPARFSGDFWLLFITSFIFHITKWCISRDSNHVPIFWIIHKLDSNKIGNNTGSMNESTHLLALDGKPSLSEMKANQQYIAG